jgi:hypothetical protein
MNIQYFCFYFAADLDDIVRESVIVTERERERVRVRVS